MTLSEILALPVSASTRMIYATDQAALYYIPAGSAGSAAKPAGSPNSLELLTTAARKDPDSYAATGGPVVGVTRVTTSTDSPGILWNLVTLPVTDDASWIGIPYTIDSSGDVVVSMQLADVTGTVPEVGVLGRASTTPSVGDGYSVGGRRLAMDDYPAENAVGQASYVKTISGGSSNIVRTTTGYVAARLWDGSIIRAGAGLPDSDITLTVSSASTSDPWGRGAPKPVHIWSCASLADTTESGDLTKLNLGHVNNGSFYGLDALEDLQVTARGSLDLRGLSALTYLRISFNERIKFIDLSMFPLLESFQMTNSSKIEEIDATHNTLALGSGLVGTPTLKKVSVGVWTDNWLQLALCPALTEIHVGSAPNATHVMFQGSGLSGELEFSWAPNLTSVDISDNSVSTLNVSGMSGMTRLKAKNNQISRVITTGWNGSYYHGHHHGVESVELQGNLLTTDAVYEMLDQAENAIPGTIIHLAGNPCEVGSVLQDGDTWSAAQLIALAALKGYALDISTP